MTQPPKTPIEQAAEEWALGELSEYERSLIPRAIIPETGEVLLDYDLEQAPKQFFVLRKGFCAGAEFERKRAEGLAAKAQEAVEWHKKSGSYHCTIGWLEDALAAYRGSGGEPMKEKLSKKCNQAVLFDLDGFIRIRKFDGWHFWLENAHGEGTQVRKQELLNVLQKLFERLF